MRWLAIKEWRELLASRAWWVLLTAMGPLVGVTFISATRTYAELSGPDGAASGVGEAFSPLVGIWAPTFSACELAAVFLLPFVAIRLAAGDRQSGALKLELQRALSPLARISIKALILCAGWILASIPAALAVILWRAHGGFVNATELLTVTAGHLLNAALTIALASAAGTIAEHHSTAAILTLTVTVGTWIVNFIAAVHGGVWEQAAAYTPTAMVADFQHGLVRLDEVLIASVLVIFGLGLAAIWIRLGIAARRRSLESAAAALAAAVLIAVSTQATASWDTSENRMNSFAAADEAALRAVRGPLRLDVHLAPEDPRRVDLERRALAKLRRVMRLDVEYTSKTGTGLFEQTGEHYGELWYSFDGRRVVSRATTEEGVLDAIYEVTRAAPVASPDEAVFRGHPLAAAPRGAALLFYAVWPAAVLTLMLVVGRRHT